MTETAQWLERPDGERLAYRRTEGVGTTVLWIGGFRSDMEGTKALALEAAARERGWGFVRYDHFAHGVSTGDWSRATIGRWRDDAVAMIDHIGGPVIPVGSSMGGWVALLAALARPEAVPGLVLIAPAPDFTERLMWPSLEDHVRQAILRDGEAAFSDPDGLGDYSLTRQMFEEARDWLVLDRAIPLECPVRILHGQADDVVPWQHVQSLVSRLLEGPAARDVSVDYVAGGDHRLSTPIDLERLIGAVESMRARS